MRLLTETEAADHLQCTIACMRRWRREGRGPQFAKLGRLVRYRPEDVDEFVRREIIGRGDQIGSASEPDTKAQVPDRKRGRRVKGRTGARGN